MKKKFACLISVICLIITGFLLSLVANAAYDSPITSCSSGIKDNGLGGIYIDINSAPYTSFSHIPVNSKYYGYTQYGCAWYASARVNELTGKGTTIWSATSWWTKGESYGFTRSSTPVEGSIICMTNRSGDEHVAILEKIVGSTAYISEGGYDSAGAAHGYCLIRTVNVSNIKSQYATSDFGSYTNFLGYVCFNGSSAITAPSAPTNCQSASWGGRVQIQWETAEYASGYECGLINKETNNVDFKADTTDYYYNFYDVPNGTYYAYVAAYNSAGYSRHSNWYSVNVISSAPSAPTNCQSASWGGRVQIQWETVEYASGYECGLINKETNNVDFKADTTDYYYNFYDVPNGTYYAYVAAYNSAGYSRHSNWASVDVSFEKLPSFSITQYDEYVEIINESNIEYTPAIIIAKYENGKLADLSCANITFAASEKRNISIDSGDIKVFVWNSLKEMVPLAYP